MRCAWVRSVVRVGMRELWVGESRGTLGLSDVICTSFEVL